MDLAGIDILAARRARPRRRGSTPAEQPAFALPPVVDAAGRARLDRRQGRTGFYKKDGDGEILALDFPRRWSTGRPNGRASRRSMRRAASTSPAERIRTLFGGKDKVGEFLRATLAPTLLYAAAHRRRRRRLTRRHRSRDALGLRLGARPVRDAARHRRRCGRRRARRRGARRCATFSTQPAAPSGDARPTVDPRLPAPETGVVRKNAGASLVDLGDGVLGVEFHSKMNAIGGDTIEMLQPRRQGSRRNFAALVVGNDGAALLRRREPACCSCSKRRKATGTKST